MGIVGLGGLGHMGLKFAHAMGAHGVLFTTSTHRADDAKCLGAPEVVHIRGASQLEKHANRVRLHPGHGFVITT